MLAGRLIRGIAVYRLKMISNAFGIDDRSPIYPTLESARQVAQLMMRIYRGQVKIEIYQVVDQETRQKRVVETIGHQ